MGRLLLWVIGIIVAIWLIGLIFKLAIKLLIIGTVIVVVLYVLGMFSKRS